jgi:rhodanese-related sulfurtransferase
MAISQTTPREAHALLQQDPAAVYLDVRTDGEFDAGHPAGARNVPVMLLDPATGRPQPNAEFVAAVERDLPRSTRLVVGCQAGGRSQRACELLAAAGFTHLANVPGGFGGGQDAAGNPVPGWAECGLPVEKGPGR